MTALLEVGTRVSYYVKGNSFRPGHSRGVVTRVTAAGTVFVRPDGHPDAKEVRFAAGSVGAWSGVQALTEHQLATERWWAELPKLKLVDVTTGFAGDPEPRVSLSDRGLKADPNYLVEVATELRAVAAWLRVQPARRQEHGPEFDQVLP